MNPYRTRDLARISVGVLAISVLMSYFGPVVLQDRSDEHRVAQSLEDAQAQAQRQFLKEKAAARFCRENFGESSVVWTVDDEPVCVPRGYIHRRNQIASN